MTHTNLALLAEKIINAWQFFDVDAISALYDKSIVAHMNDQDVHYEDIMHRMDYSKQHFESIQFHVQDLMFHEDKIILRADQTWTIKATGEKKSHQIMVIYQTKDDKVIEMWALFNPGFNYLAK